MGKIVDDIYIAGHLRADTMTIPDSSVTNASIASTGISRAKFTQEDNAVYPIDINSLRVWDNLASLLPAAAANDDLGIYDGTFGTDAPMVKTGDLKSAGSTSRYARFQVALPPEYEDGETVTIRVSAGMITTVADTAATVDIECYQNNRDGTIGSDLCTTSATSVNSLTFANYSYTITPTGLSPGDILDVRITFLVNDGTAVTVVEGAIGAIELLCDIKG